jgi:hypothetical protein
VTEQKNTAVEIVEMSNVVIDIRDVSTDTLSPGDDFTLTMTIQNVGSGEIRWMRVGIDPLVNTIPILIPNDDDLEKVYREIGEETVTAAFDLSVGEDLDSGNYPITVAVTYQDDLGNVVTESHIIGLEIRGSPRIVIQGIDSDPKIPFKGEDVTLSVSLENIGTGDAKIVKVRFVSETGEFVSYVGGIEKSDSSAAVFNTVAPIIESEKQQIKIFVEYEDETGNKKVIEDVYTLGLKEKERIGILPLAGIGIVIVLVIVYWWLKKRRELKKLMK